VNQAAEQAGPLAPRVARGAIWITGSRLSGRIFDALKALVLARLLAPADFGLFGLAMLALVTIDTFSQTGFNAALIQRPGDIRPHLSSAWTVQVLRGAGLATLLFLGSPLLSMFFNEPELTALLRVMCLAILLQGFINTGIVFFDRELEFQRSFVYEVGSNAISLAVGVVLAYALRSAWALAWANLAGVCAKVVLSFALAEVKPRFELVQPRLAELFTFGKWMSGGAIAAFVWQNIDRVVVGRVLGVSSLGVYQMALRIALLPASHVAVGAMGVTLPAYAKLQGQPERMGRTFLDVFETAMSIIAPMTLFLAVAAPEVVVGLLGSHWMDAVWPLRILAVGCMCAAVDTMATPLLVGTGRPRVEFWKNVVRSTVVLGSIYPLTATMGLTGACISFAAGSAAPLFFWGSVMKIGQIRWRDLAARGIVAGTMAASVPPVVLTTRAIVGDPGALALFVSVTACAVSWCVVGYGLRTFSGLGILVHLTRLKAAWLDYRRES